MSEEYQIEATIEKIEADVKNGKIWKIQIKGVGKYLFEKEKDKKYWNIFEKNEAEHSKLKEQEKPIEIDISNDKLELKHLIHHAFLEKKKLKFELDENFKIIAISNASN